MSFFSQMRMLAQESHNTRQDRNMLISALVISVVAAYVIRYDMFGTYENAKIGFFIIVCCAMWMGLFDSILCICDHRAVLERDKFSGLKPVPFILATMVFQALRAVVQALVMLAATMLIIDWPQNAAPLVMAAPLEYFLTLFLVTFAAQMLGLAVSALMKTSEGALTFAPFLLIYELIMSETIFGLPQWLEPLRNTTIVRWGMDALGTTYNIDALPWKAEGKIQELLDQAAANIGEWVSSWGLDPSGIVQYVAGYNVDPSIMGVDHDLPEYLATVGNLETIWMWLLLLAAIGAVAGIIGFAHKAKTR